MNNMNNMNNNIPPNGVLPDVIKFDSWIAGDNSKIVDKVRGDLTQYTSRSEAQNRGFETFGCVTFSALDALECILNYEIAQGNISEDNLDWLSKNGYFNTDKKLDFSDRFIHIMSGTTMEGNSLDTVAETIRKKGLIPETLLSFGGSSFAEYANKKLITKEMLDLGQEFLTRFKIAHDWVITYGMSQDKVIKTYRYYSTHCPIQNATPVCPTWHTGNVKSCPLLITQHATGTYAVDTQFVIHDQYDPFWKRLDLDYPMICGKRYDIIEIVVNPETKQPLSDYPDDAPKPPKTNDTVLVRLWHSLLTKYFRDKFNSK